MGNYIGIDFHKQFSQVAVMLIFDSLAQDFLFYRRERKQAICLWHYILGHGYKQS